MSKYVFDPSILRAYDIRGIIDETLTDRDAFMVGRCFGTIVRDRGGKLVTLGRDGRLSSETLEKAMTEGLMACGLEVLTIGLVPTPALYYSEYYCEADGAIMITGSHNPMNHNGFKLSLNKRSFHGEDIKNFAILARGGTFAEGNGHTKSVDILDSYINQLARDYYDHYAQGRELKVAWDMGNGVAGPSVKKLTEKLPGTHILLNEEIDGTFPNHHPDPQDPKNLIQLQEVVLREKCHLGLAFDGDGDRLGIVDDKGRMVWGDQLLLLCAEEVISHKPGALIVADVKASQTLFDEVKKMGGKPLMWCTGHSLIKKKMAEIKADLGGEMSGHLFFKDRYYGFDDALYAAIRVMGITSLRMKPLSKWYDALPKLKNTPEIKIDCGDERKFQIVEDVKRRVQAANANVIDIDGVRVTSDKGWWLLRASNTGGSLIARVEAENEDDLQGLQDDLRSNLAMSGIKL